LERVLKYSEKHSQVLLDEKYLFAYLKSDGFSERLLNATFLMDYNYNYVLEFNAFSHDKITINQSDNFIEKGTIEGTELKFIETLLSADYHSLKRSYDYEGLSIDDIGSQSIFINLDEITKDIHIISGLAIENFKTEVEKLLFNFNEYMKSSIEMKYDNWIAK
jgi:hypothetical protein